MTATTIAPNRLGYELYDADQHYYEPMDAFTRYLPSEFKNALYWVTTDGGRKQLIVGGTPFTMIGNPTFNPVPKPGSLLEYMKAENTTGKTGKAITGDLEPLQPEYINREARMAIMDTHGLRSALLLPTISLGFEELLWENPAALNAVIHAGNEWLLEDWGYNNDGRLICAPMLSIADTEAAEKELQWVIERGAKAITLRPGPVRTPEGARSPGDPRHDRFWSIAAEAGVVICYHVADAGYNRYAPEYGERAVMGTFGSSPFIETLSLHLERPIYDTMAALIGHGALDRNPGLKVAAIEFGSGWVPDLLRRLATAYGRIPQHFGKDPVEAFHEHVWVTPFHEQSMLEVLGSMHADRILFGSDWPHPEGVVQPADFIEEVEMLPDDVVRRIMADNMRDLLKL